MTINIKQIKSKPYKVNINRSALDTLKLDKARQYAQIKKSVATIYKSYLRIRLAKLIYKINK